MYVLGPGIIHYDMPLNMNWAMSEQVNCLPLNSMPAEQPQRKSWEKPAPYTKKPGPKGPRIGANSSNASSARAQQQTRRSNLTLHDWMTVFAYIDSHPAMSQSDIVGVPLVQWYRWAPRLRDVSL